MSEPAPLRSARLGVLRPLSIRDLRLLWTGLAVFMVGDGIYVVSIAFQVLDLSNSAGALALVGIAWTLPQVLSCCCSDWCRVSCSGGCRASTG